MLFKIAPLAAAVVFSFSGSLAHADEGIATITTLGDQRLIAQTRKEDKAKAGPVYKSVENPDEQSSGGGDYFEGKPPVHAQNIFGGLGVDFFESFGIQARYAYRVLTDGLIEGLNNPLYLEGGLGMTFYGTQVGKRGVTGFNVVLTGRWDFQMDEQWIFFADAGFGVTAVSSGLKADDVRGGGFFPAVGVGAMFNINQDTAVRADVSYQFLGAGLLYRF